MQINAAALLQFLLSSFILTVYFFFFSFTVIFPFSFCRRDSGRDLYFPSCDSCVCKKEKRRRSKRFVCSDNICGSVMPAVKQHAFIINLIL